MRLRVLTSRVAAGLILLCAQAVCCCAVDSHAPDFNASVRPILSNTCYHCHGPDEAHRAADLRLDQEEAAKEYVIVPGDLDASELIRRITSEDPDERMPPPDEKQQLSPQQIETLKRWVASGAAWEKHWSFVPPKREAYPEVRDADWPHVGIDYFTLARLESRGLTPSPRASRETLIRRVTLDLTGLPPTLEEVDGFLADESPEAYERVVDRLLASPRYGEHMALAWLAAARYADTNGYQQDRTRTMWPWRDWVIRSMNDNMPFDEFTINQLAGDLLENPTQDQLIATGFHRNHALNGEGGRNAEESRVEYVVDRAETTGTVWMGLTVGCARCHDHKYDSVSQKEFYQLYAYFNTIDENGGVDAGGNAKPVMALPTDEQRAEIARLRKEIAAVEDEIAALGNVTAAGTASEQPTSARKEQRSREAPFRQQIEQLKKSIQEIEGKQLYTMVMRERKQPRSTFRLVRGIWNNPDESEQIHPDVFGCLPPLADGAPKSRLTLARWLMRPDHPLTARVTVNRYWQHFFGTGIVKTSEDFGVQGDLPSHPKLLDWLATEFIQSGWNVKQLHKLIVLSATYQQSSRASPELVQRDPQNRLLSRGPRFRLSAQALRDQALAVSGLLVNKIGGPGVMPYQPTGVWSDFSLGKIKYKRGEGDELYRRSVYIFWRRSVGPTVLFDNPARQMCTVRPSLTNTPLHALTTLNDVTYVEAARALAQRVMTAANDSETRIQLAFRLATSRHATERELQKLLTAYDEFLREFQEDRKAAKALLAVGEYPLDKQFDEAELAAYACVMNAILNLDEVLTKG